MGLSAGILTGTSELSNLRFLVAQQLRAIDELDRRGLDGRDARDLLARLMRRHEEVRDRALAARPGPARRLPPSDEPVHAIG